MDKITVTRSFRFVDLWETHGREYAPGDYAVVERPAGPNECSPECARVALAEGWAVWSGGTVKPSDDAPAILQRGKEAVKTPPRPTGSRTGKAKPSASSRPARRSTKAKPKK